MKLRHFLLSTATLAIATPALADADEASQAGPAESEQTAAPPKKAFTTGVARGRDMLDTAISASAFDETTIQNLSARSLGELLRNIPGIRADASNGESSANITIRGLPLSTTGAKFLQLQENGLPVLEFGDINNATADMLLRVDLNLDQVQSLRGGSSSSFASNSPGGVINLIDKTGDVEGGSLRLSTGVDYPEYRGDFDYGAPLGETWRFHIGGFYRQGEGPRSPGFTAEKGGQVKFNVTKTLPNGYVRLYAKYLDDITPLYSSIPMMVNGTNSNPSYDSLPNFKIGKDMIASPYIQSNLLLDQNNDPSSKSLHEGLRVKSKSIALESQLNFGKWRVTERFKVTGTSGRYTSMYPARSGNAQAVANSLAGAGATMSYASGPLAGQAITDPTTLGGNGLLIGALVQDHKFNSLDNMTNDIRVSRVWNIGGGKLTATAGFYKSRQTVDAFLASSSIVTSLAGDGQAVLIDVSAADGTPYTQNGVYAYMGTLIGNIPPKRYDVDYDTNAGYGSLNYHIGKVAIGASVRYNFGGANGTIYGAALGGGRTGVISYDMNNDGVISVPEQKVGVLPLGQPSPVNYDYNFVSYSGGINYRMADNMSLFARYSRGARVNSDRLLYTPVIDSNDGSLAVPDSLIDYVRQVEGGVKFRTSNLSVDVTAFLANTQEHNVFFGTIINRSYRTYGLELDSQYTRGIFSIAAGATYTKAKITKDAVNPAVEGNVPQRQPNLTFVVTPTVNFDRVTAGVNVYGTTDSYALDVDLLKIPGYMTVNPFVDVKVGGGVSWSLNVNNLFDVRGINFVATSGTVQAGSIVNAQSISGRTISTALRFDF